MLGPKPLRVLVVDDNADFGESLRLLMETVGCEVDLADTPYAGVTLSEAVRYDLVLMDYQMPGMDGLETLRLLGPRGHRCMLLLTGAPEAVSLLEARLAGAEAVLPKPVDVDRLIEIARYIAEQESDVVSLPPGLKERRWEPAGMACAA
jgi:CheY-like chemotaxis protein